MFRETDGEVTFLFTAVDELKIFGNSGAGVWVHIGIRKAERKVVTHFSVLRNDAAYCAVA